MRAHRETPSNLPGDVSLSNAFVFIHFRTLCAPWSLATPFPSTTSALFPISWQGGVPSSLFSFLPSAFCFLLCPLSPLCFQQLPTIKFSNSFLLITIQNAPRVWGVRFSNFDFRVSSL